MTLFIKNISFKYVLLIIIFYVIITFLIAYYFRKFLEEKLNKMMTEKIRNLQVIINELVKDINEELKSDIDLLI